MAWINSKIEDLLNYRIQEEELSSRMYLAMSKWLFKQGYFGAATLYKKYSDEEIEHAGWAYAFLEKMSLQPIVPELSKVNCEFESLLDIVEKTLDHELEITEQCNKLAFECSKAEDYMTFELAQKYLKEQAEEIDKATYWIDRVKTFGDCQSALLIIDKEMGGE